MRTVPYDCSRDALYRPHLAPSIFPVEGRPTEELLCAESSRLVYKRFERSPEAKAEVDNALQTVGFNEVKDLPEHLPEGGTQAFAAWSSDSRTALIAFRGTQQDDPTDLVDDVDIRRVSWEKGGRAHEGFHRAFGRVREEIERWIGQHEPERLLLTGHSLGAALSTLAASLWRPHRLITFGSPRVGDHEFVETLKGIDQLRYVDCCDIVTRVFPETLGFEHLEPVTYIDRLGQVTPGATDELILHDRRTAREDYLLRYAWRKGNVAVRDLADHAPINYVYALLNPMASK